MFHNHGQQKNKEEARNINVKVDVSPATFIQW